MLDQEKYTQLMSLLAKKDTDIITTKNDSLHELSKKVLKDISAGAGGGSCSHTNHGAHVNHSKTTCK